MSHMELSRNVRRRHYRCERLSAPVHLSVKIFVLTPSVIQLSFDLLRIVSLFQFPAHDFLLVHPHSSRLVSFLQRLVVPVRRDCPAPAFCFTESSQFSAKKSPFTHVCKGRISAVPPYFIYTFA